MNSRKKRLLYMKNFLASLGIGIVLVLAAPTTFAADGADIDDAAIKPISGTATGSESQSIINTQTIVGGAIGVVGAGLLIGLAADDNDGDNISVTTTTTTN